MTRKRRVLKKKKTTKKKAAKGAALAPNADLWAKAQPLSLEINVFDIFEAKDVVITPGTGAIVATGAAPTVELSPEQRSRLKRMLEKAYGLIPYIEVGVEISPDGNTRIYIRPRT